MFNILFRYFSLRYVSLIVLLLTPSANTWSADISFDFVDFNFTSSTINLSASPEKIEGNGFGFALSLGFNPHYALTLSVDATTFDNFQHKPVESIKTTTLGIVAHTQLTNHTAVYGDASALVAETTTNKNATESGQSGMGYKIKAGVRQMVGTSIELEFTASHFYALDYPANNLYAAIRYYTNKHLAIGFAYRAGSNQDTIAAHARASF